MVSQKLVHKYLIENSFLVHAKCGAYFASTVEESSYVTSK